MTKPVYKISGLIYNTFNDVIKVIKKEFGWCLNYIKVYIRPMHEKQIELTGNTLSINPYFTKYLKDNNLEFDNIKKFFVLLIAKELGKELYNRFWDKDTIDKWNKLIDRTDLEQYDTEEDKLSTYFSILIYTEMKERLDAYGKAEQSMD